MLSSIKFWALIIGASLIAFFAWDYARTKHKYADVKNKLETANLTVDSLDDLILRNEEIRKEEAEIINEIHKAPASDDGAIAPVLRRTIKRLSSDSK